MKIEIGPLQRLFGTGETGVVYNFPSVERLSDGSFYVCARKIKSLTDPRGVFEAVRYLPESGAVYPTAAPNQKEFKHHPEKGYYTCHVTELSPGKLIAVYTVIDCDETRPLFSPDGDGIQDTVCHLSRSEDYGETWSQPEELAYQIQDVIIPSKIQRMKDGTIGFPIEVHNRYNQPYQEPIQARFIYSKDGAKTFDCAAEIPHPENFLAGDARCTFDEDGNMVVFYWGFDLEKMCDLAIYRTRTDDAGKTFAPVAPISLKKQISSPLYVGKDVFLCMYQERFSEKPGIKAMLSYDGGWHYDPATEAELVTYEVSPDTENPFSGYSQYQFGYSTLTRVSQNSALAAFWHKEGDAFAVSACMLRVE